MASIYVLPDLSGYVNPTIVDNPSLFPDPTTVPGAWYLAENSSGYRWLFTYKSEGLYYSNGVKWITGNQILPLTQVELDAGTETEKYVNAFTFENAAKWLTKLNVSVFEEQNQTIKDPTGFPNRTDSTFSFDDGTRTFTIQPTGVSFDYWTQGTKNTITTSKTLVLPNVTAKYFIYFNEVGQTLGYSTTFSDAILNLKVLVATVYYNATTGKGEFVVDERHGLTMDWATHFHLHNAFGTRYYGGFGLSYTPGDGSLDAHAEISLGGGTIADEDIPTTIVDAASPSAFFEQILSPIAQIPVVYKLGAGEWQKDTANNWPIKDGGGNIYYNLETLGTYSLQAVTNNSYVAVWIFATPEVSTPVISILGQREDASLNDAKNNNTYDTIDWGDLPSQEYKILYRIIYEYKNTYANSVKAKIVDVLDLRGSIDGTLASGNFTPVADHGNLIGLADDDHPQYHNDARGDLRYPPLSRTLTINGVTYDLSANRSWTVATGSSWNSVVIVNSVSDLPAASGGTHLLLDNTTYWFSEGTFNFTNTLTLGTGTNIFGITKGTTILNYTGSGNFINITNKNNTLRNLQFLGTASGTLYNVTNASTNTLNVEDCNINTWGSYGTVNGGGYVCFNTIHLAPSVGLTFTGTLRNLILLNSSFRTLTASSYYLRFNNAAANSIRIANNLFDINTNGIGIQQSGTFSVTAAKGLLTSNVFNFLGTPSSGTSGFDHTSTAWRFTGNEGIANKVEEIFFSSSEANASGTGTNPTTSAPAGYLTLPNTGTRVIVMAGGNADNNSVSYDFKMPDDYFSGGEILIQYSNAVGATGNIRWQGQVHSKNIGDSLDTQTEIGLGVTVSTVTGNTRAQGTITPNAANFAAGKFITIRIYRLGNDAADTANNQNAYIVGVTFKYNAR